MAFHSYAHLIQKLFNAYWCGPPSGVTRTSPWTCVDHLVSRLPHPTNTPYSGSLSLRLRASIRLTSPDMATRRLIMQKARRHYINMQLRPLEGGWFQELFHSPRGVLFTFPSRYWYTIGLVDVFSLTGWSRQIHTGFLVSRATQDTARPGQRSHTGLSPSTARISNLFRSASQYLKTRSYNPDDALPQRRFGLIPGRSPLPGESLSYFLFLWVLRCFSSPR